MLSLKRAYIGGLSKDINEKDLSERFRTFGEITEVEIIRQATGSKNFLVTSRTCESRGFAYVTLKITENSWKKCVNIFNGAKWNGITLKIQEAKPDYKQRLKQEWETQKKDNEQSSHPPSTKKRKRPKKGEVVVELSKDMRLVTDSNIDEQKKWKRINNNGRVATVMRMRKPDGSKVTIDPSKYQKNHRKIFNNINEVKPKPLYELIMYYDNEKEVREEENQSEQKYCDDVYREKKKLFDIPAVLNSSVKFTIFLKLTTFDRQKEHSNKIRLEALKKRGLEEREKKAKIVAALRRDSEEKKKGHIVFSGSDSEENEQKESPSKKMNLFSLDNESNEDDDSDDNSYQIEINQIFEGSSGRKLLNLQKRFHGDTQKPETTQSSSNDRYNKKEDDITSMLIEEKSKNMNILHTMFDNMEIEKSQFKTNRLNHETLWKEMIHFDPDAPEEEIKKTKRVEDDNADIEFTRPSSILPPPPQVSKEVKIEINADFKGIFAPSASSNVVSSFSLFGNNNEKNEGNKNPDREIDVVESIDDNSKCLFSSQDIRQTSASHPSSRPANNSFTATTSGPLFFFHFGDEALEKRSHFRELNTFMRTVPIEEIIKNWENTRQNLTQEFKRKHKSVSRKRRKMQRKMNQN
ncbi:3090_t:CDS:10 [Ambispora gerdemannii]|uniref:3090_t:CDS:1 n=1 Tax=Ambispora gerdemannii TaxID=144530 RepID=A0A9N9AKM1_9GLOM|nr:3090_t:CDS:10 [Ambispora gerdemannii]